MYGVQLGWRRTVRQAAARLDRLPASGSGQARFHPLGSGAFMNPRSFAMLVALAAAAVCGGCGSPPGGLAKEELRQVGSSVGGPAKEASGEAGAGFSSQTPEARCPCRYGRRLDVDTRHGHYGKDYGVGTAETFHESPAVDGVRNNEYRTDGREATRMRIAVILAMIEPGHWRSRCPSLPGCGAMGQSRQEALRNIDLAIRGYVASLDVPFPLTLSLSISPV